MYVIQFSFRASHIFVSFVRSQFVCFLLFCVYCVNGLIFARNHPACYVLLSKPIQANSWNDNDGCVGLGTSTMLVKIENRNIFALRTSLAAFSLPIFIQWSAPFVYCILRWLFVGRIWIVANYNLDIFFLFLATRNVYKQ